MLNYKVKMTIYYEFEGVEADNEEHAKEAIVDEDWDRHIKDVIFDVEKEKYWSLYRTDVRELLTAINSLEEKDE